MPPSARRGRREGGHQGLPPSHAGGGGPRVATLARQWRWTKGCHPRKTRAALNGLPPSRGEGGNLGLPPSHGGGGGPKVATLAWRGRWSKGCHPRVKRVVVNGLPPWHAEGGGNQRVATLARPQSGTFDPPTLNPRTPRPAHASFCTPSTRRFRNLGSTDPQPSAPPSAPSLTTPRLHQPSHLVGSTNPQPRSRATMRCTHQIASSLARPSVS